MQYAVVDLGTKVGGAMDVIRSYLSRSGDFWAKFYQMEMPAAKTCLGITNNKQHVQPLRKKGYAAEILDLNKQFPEHRASMYSAFHFLEHVRDVAKAQELMRKMLEQSTAGVWWRLPSFEPIEEFEKHELRWYWTNWSGHTAPVRLSHVYEVLQDVTRPFKLRIRPVRHVQDSSAEEVIPAGSPRNSNRYTKSMGPKPKVVFKTPLITASDVHIRWQEA